LFLLQGQSGIAKKPDTVRIARAGSDFSDWTGLLELLHEAFAYMDARIDPPSSLHRLTPASIAGKAKEETLLLATDKGELVGCVFAVRKDDALYVGKLAVRTSRQGNGVGRRLMDAAEELARRSGLAFLELSTRVELVENHATFAAMGFAKTAETSHQGYDRPTAITMRKRLHSPR
jgi:predicted N-acetyltransferase YhbS